MGCCESSEVDDEYNTRETDPLVGANGSMGSGNHANPSSVEASGNQSKNDSEQSALARILQQTASNIIDVAGGEAMPVVEEGESQQKNRQYSAKLDKVHISIKPDLSQGRANPQSILSEPGIPASDLDLVAEAAEKTAHCMGKVVVHHKEDLIVPFGVP